MEFIKPEDDFGPLLTPPHFGKWPSSRKIVPYPMIVLVPSGRVLESIPMGKRWDNIEVEVLNLGNGQTWIPNEVLPLTSCITPSSYLP